MKRILFCAGVLALAASCTESEYDSLSVKNEAVKGVTFGVEIAETPATRADLAPEDAEGVQQFFWYAEQDRINIWSTNTTDYNEGSDSEDNANSTGTFDVNKKAQYKATKSMANGDFTAIDDENWILFSGSSTKVNPSEFLAIYPTSINVDAIDGDKTNGYTVTLTNLPAIANQNTSALNGSAVTDLMPMYSYTTAYPTNSYDGVGEKIGLNLIRPFGAAKFVTKGVTEYSKDGASSLFGQLKKITLTAKGYDADGDGTIEDGDIAPSILAYTPTAVKYVLNTKDVSKSKFVDTSDQDITDWSDKGSSKIVLTLNSGTGLNWTDDDVAYMAINYINRTVSKFTAEKPETMVAKYEFANITFNVEWTTTNNWPSTQGNNMFSGMRVLDMANYPYLVTNETSLNANDRALIVNSGNFIEAYNTANNKIKWNGEEIDLSKFSTVISKVNLNDTELALLKKFTNLKSIQLAENTTIPSKTFDGLSAITSIDMPKVTSIADDAFESTVQLATVKLASYKFEKKSVNNVLLKADYLTTLDMSSVETMKNVFPAEGFALTGFDQLTEVKVMDGVKVGSAAFKGCTSLTEIDGMVNVSEGPNAFEGSGITTITLTNTDIPAGAFKDCDALTEVLGSDKKDLQPTKVGNAAFSGSGIINMDLSKVVGDESVIGEEAFKNCTAFVGTADAARGINVLYVGAKTISASAFAGCKALEYVEFTNATKIEDNILATDASNVVTLKELKFKQVLVSTKGSTTMFGTTTNTKLFLNPEQPLSYYEGNTFYPKGNKGNPAITFNSIILE